MILGPGIQMIFLVYILSLVFARLLLTKNDCGEMVGGKVTNREGIGSSLFAVGGTDCFSFTSKTVIQSVPLKTWEEAVHHCKDKDKGGLAVFHDATTFVNVGNRILNFLTGKDVENQFIGARYDRDVGGYVWWNYEAFNFDVTLLDTSDSIDFEEGKCLAIDVNTGSIVSEDCSSPLGFVCMFRQSDYYLDEDIVPMIQFAHGGENAHRILKETTTNPQHISELGLILSDLDDLKVYVPSGWEVTFYVTDEDIDVSSFIPTTSQTFQGPIDGMEVVGYDDDSGEFHFEYVYVRRRSFNTYPFLYTPNDYVGDRIPGILYMTLPVGRLDYYPMAKHTVVGKGDRFPSPRIRPQLVHIPAGADVHLWCTYLLEHLEHFQQSSFISFDQEWDRRIKMRGPRTIYGNSKLELGFRDIGMWNEIVVASVSSIRITQLFMDQAMDTQAKMKVLDSIHIDNPTDIPQQVQRLVTYSVYDETSLSIQKHKFGTNIVEAGASLMIGVTGKVGPTAEVAFEATVHVTYTHTWTRGTITEEGTVRGETTGKSHNFICSAPAHTTVDCVVYITEGKLTIPYLADRVFKYLDGSEYSEEFYGVLIHKDGSEAKMHVQQDSMRCPKGDYWGGRCYYIDVESERMNFREASDHCYKKFGAGLPISDEIQKNHYLHEKCLTNSKVNGNDRKAHMWLGGYYDTTKNLPIWSQGEGSEVFNRMDANVDGVVDFDEKHSSQRMVMVNEGNWEMKEEYGYKVNCIVCEGDPALD